MAYRVWTGEGRGRLSLVVAPALYIPGLSGVDTRIQRGARCSSKGEIQMLTLPAPAAAGNSIATDGRAGGEKDQVTGATICTNWAPGEAAVVEILVTQTAKLGVEEEETDASISPRLAWRGVAHGRGASSVSSSDIPSLFAGTGDWDFPSRKFAHFSRFAHIHASKKQECCWWCSSGRRISECGRKSADRFPSR